MAGVPLANKTRAEAVRYVEMLVGIVAENYMSVYLDNGRLLCLYLMDLIWMFYDRPE